MQLEQTESFEIKGPQLEVFGRIEDRLPAPARKKPAAAAVLAVAVAVGIFGIGGARLAGQYGDILSDYSNGVDRYGHGIQTDFSAQADAAASMIRVAEDVDGADGAVIEAAAETLDLWNNASDPQSPAKQYTLNQDLYYAVDAMFTDAYDTANGKQKGQLDDLYSTFTSAQATIDRAGAAYNEKAAAYNEKAGKFPANLIAGLWNTAELELFAPIGG